ncbi:DNA-binding protein [Paramagnetospirillum magneticum]|uniref:HTH Mu-type domain-containing protein n=1 Tax=Paramagnetospirillum magneticum (strain ATCC 700264 / AMB-1) TaxID=342108 RepID=Q2W6I7_PARM1|nr:DNA-binding protein [Paramagnetospirillum magneticum]BAE50538.1 hypothetical protein amb1734 [Paramagnetospirillum magneticum AMB-1]
MDKGQDSFDLSVTIPASELAQLRRRVLYLEAALIQVIRDQRRIKEWFTAAELVALRLPGLPTSKAAVTRIAREQGWTTEKVPCQGGERHAYHFTSLPRRAFQGLIDMVLAPPPGAVAPVDQVPELPEPEPAPMPPPNAAPPWVLPLMRMIRHQGAANVAEAIRELPAFLPPGVACPSMGEAMEVLRALGMVAS